MIYSRSLTKSMRLTLRRSVSLLLVSPQISRKGDATLRDVYYKQIVKAGGTPVLIPPVADKEVLVNTLTHLDGLLLTGGGDINPLWMGEEPSTHYIISMLNVIWQN